MLQQYLPLAVLKRIYPTLIQENHHIVATVLTACGIETYGEVTGLPEYEEGLQQYLPLAVLKRLL